ncbi:kinase-like domain-containing protein [Amanita rubescens]|nr:kinase-like domain-containing protein [Amanita rubescens]
MPRSLLLPEVMMKTDSQEIGRGGFAFVLKGEMQGRPVALKVLHRVRHKDVRTHLQLDFCREAFIWRTLSHEHVLALLGIHENPLGRFLVSPYMENGTLSSWRKKKTFSSVEVQQRILEAAKGIRYIHSENMVHGDIRGDNVLLDSHFRVKIADFGLARHNDATATQSWALSYNFAAPELFGDYDSDDISSESDRDVQLMKRTFKTDIYAFACLYYEIHFDSIPFKNNSHPQIIKMVTSGQRPPLFPKPELNAVAWKLIRRCWRREPARRPSMEDVVDNMMSWQSPSKK